MTAAAAAVDVCNGLLRHVEEFAEEMTAEGGHAARTQDLGTLKQKAITCLQQLDAISNTLCMVLDAAEACRNVHSDSAWRDAAEECFGALGAFMFQLNAHYPLFQALFAITSNPLVMNALTPEQRRMAVMLRREFEKDGIHLPDEKRQRLVGLNSEMHSLASQFSQGAANCLGMGAVEVPLESFPSLLKAEENTIVLPANLRSAVTIVDKKRNTRVSLPDARKRLEAGDSTSKSGLIVHIPLGGCIPEHLLRHCPDSAVRRAVLEGQLRAPRPNLPALHALRDKRHEIASEGFPSYSHMVSYDRLSGSPLRAVDFLQRLQATTLPKAVEELAWIAEAKAAEANGLPVPLYPLSCGPEQERSVEQRIEDACCRYVNACALGAGKVNAWDHQYYITKILQARLKTEWDGLSEANGSSGPAVSENESAGADTTPRPLHTLSSVISGIQRVCERVFGIKAELCSVSSQEAWDGGSGYTLPASCSLSSASVSPSLLSRFGSGGGSGSATGILKLRLSHPSDGDLGTIYLDLFPRPNKFNGAAHFVVRSSKRLHGFDGGLEKALGTSINSGGGDFQKPIVVLATNFFAAEGSPDTDQSFSSGSILPPHLSAARLSPSETITFWHEFGHALHSLLYRGLYQHLAGTRTALDFVEVPSHTSEYWARDERVAAELLSPAGSPAASSAPIKARERLLFDHYHVTGQHVSPRYAFAALQIQGDVVSSLFDLAFHGDAEVIDAVVNPLSSASKSATTGSSSAFDAHLRLPPMEKLLQSLHKTAVSWGRTLERRGGDRAVTMDDICFLSWQPNEDEKAKTQRKRDRAFVLELLDTESQLRPAEDLCVFNKTSNDGDDDDEVTTFSLGDPIAELDPAEIAARAAEASDDAAITQQQQSSFGQQASCSSSSSAFKRAWHRDSSALLAAIQSQYSLTPVVEGSAWQGGFTHLVTYGGGYYSYSYAAVFSAGIWRALFENDPWSREAGDKYRALLLGRGGSDDPAEMLKKVLGEQRQPKEAASASDTSKQAADGGETSARAGGRKASLAPLLETMGVLK
jgi:Zn-dependent oligopeptidase